MKTFQNPAILSLGVLIGILCPVSYFYFSVPTPPPQTEGSPLHLRSPKKPMEASMNLPPLPLSMPMQQTSNFEPKGRERHQTRMRNVGLEEFTNYPSHLKSTIDLSETDHIVNVVEISRPIGVEKLMNAMLDWQEKMPNRQRDIIVYIAPVYPSPSQDQLIAEAIKGVMQGRGTPATAVKGKITFVFHRRENLPVYSLDAVLQVAREDKESIYWGLRKSAIKGQIDHLVWIRTTLNRWQSISADGIPVASQMIPTEKISAFLVDPSRKTVTFIDLTRKPETLPANVIDG